MQFSRYAGGGKRIRTAGLLLARQALSQLSYTPNKKMVGLGGLEPPTSRLSGVRSNHLSYKPPSLAPFNQTSLLNCLCLKRISPFVHLKVFLRKEVIQPHLPIRLPCYDFTPIIRPTFDGSLPCGLGHRLRVLRTFVV